MASKVDALFRQAIASFQAGELAQAELSFRKLLRLEPRHLAALNILAVVLTGLKKFSEAEGYLKAALAINSTSDATHYNYGVVLKELKRPQEALERFNQALAINPSVADTWNNRGAVHNELKHYDDALADFNRAAALQPNYPGIYYNMGNSLAGLRRYDEAIAYYDKALALNPGLADAWTGRGNVCASLMQHDEALAGYEQALALNPGHAEAWAGRGQVLVRIRRLDDALAAFDKAISFKTELPDAWLARAVTLAQMKKTPEAVAAFRDAIKHGTDAERVTYHLAGIGADAAPPISPRGFVSGLFDQYAESFDQQLVDLLNYRAPVQLADMVKRIAPVGKLDILDLGCGTGLVGASFEPLRRSLTGVDLSEEMLKVARKRGSYDRLICRDVVEFLNSEDATYDLIVAADVFVYIGDLSPVFKSVHRAIRPAGLFCFSIEATAGRDFILLESLRYAHSQTYIQKLTAENRFAIEAFEPCALRQEFGTSIEGYLVLLRAP